MFRSILTTVFVGEMRYNSKMKDAFADAHKKLNQAQKKAVDTTEGPVMVVAGPGTGKTQILALRIANILKKGLAPDDGILCLTFTRSGVKAMRERLASYIGDSARNVMVQTFHSFANTLIEKNYELLDFESLPELLKDDDAVLVIDELLHVHDWKYLHSRSNPALYFSDLKSLVSILKRERITPENLISEIEIDIKKLESDPDSLSSRGPSKGELKKEIQKKIASLEKTKEVAEFFEKYEALKKERGLMDYDDVLEYAVKLVEENESVRSDLRENYLYIHVDEHQDSSGVQNSFLKAVWQEVEKPNIFVVGDDRQLIYGFGGASLSYFEEFKTMFGKAELITLVENYRSTEPILSLADTLLQSSLTKEKLKTNHKEISPVELSEYVFPRDEILGAGIHFRKIIGDGVDGKNKIDKKNTADEKNSKKENKPIPAEECALLVPKNRHVRTAVQVLRDLGLPVRSSIGSSFFAMPESEILRTVLQVIADPFDGEPVAKTLFSQVSNIPALSAHAFLYENKNKNISIENLLNYKNNNRKNNKNLKSQISDGLFDGQNPIVLWGQKLSSWLEYNTNHSLLDTVHKIGNELLVDTASGHEDLIRRIEVVRTFIHLLTERFERNHKETLQEFLDYLSRLEQYNHALPTASLSGNKGISVMTLHGSKGLEYESVWIAHMNESTLMSGKRMAFALPESLENNIEKKNKEVAKRELYVAITRAKKLCTISYAKNSHTGTELELAEILAEIPKTAFVIKNSDQTEEELLTFDPKIYVEKNEVAENEPVSELVKKVSEDFSQARVSVTLLNNFFECPWKWYFRNLLKLPEAKSDALKFGSAIHSTIEKILQDREEKKNTDEKTKNKNPDEIFIKNLIVAELENEGVKDKNDLIRLTREGLEAVNNWLEKYYPNIAKDFKTERAISYKDSKFPELTMYGKIDLTERFPDGAISVTDFKTGSSKTSGVIEKRDAEDRLSTFMRQLAMYSYLIEGAEKGQKVNESKLLFLEADKGDKNALYSTTVGQEEIDLLIRDIDDYQKLLVSGEWINRPCNYKPFGTNNSECEHCALAKKIYNL